MTRSMVPIRVPVITRIIRFSRIGRGLALVGVVALIAGGCRSDGGVGRRDSQRSLTWALDTTAKQYDRDVENTKANMKRMSNWFERETSDPWRGIDRSVNLYLEGNADP